jgi:hypothetical protein
VLLPSVAFLPAYTHGFTHGFCMRARPTHFAAYNPWWLSTKYWEDSTVAPKPVGWVLIILGFALIVLGIVLYVVW